MNSVSGAPTWGLVVSVAGPLIRILRDRLTPPQRGLRYVDLEMGPDDQLADLLPRDGDNPPNSPQTPRKPYTHFIQLTNYGREVIDAHDYIRPFSVHYGEATQVIGYRILRDDRGVHPAIYTCGSNSSGILIQEILNPGDALTFGVLLVVRGKPVMPAIDCRLRGVPHLKGHLRGVSWTALVRRIAVHYFAMPLAIVAGLVIGYVVFLALNPGTRALQDLIELIPAGFGAGVIWGLFIGIALALIVELWETYSFRSQRQALEAAFRKAAHERLDRPQPLPPPSATQCG